MFDNGLKLSEFDTNRNIAAFQTYRYTYDPSPKESKILDSTLDSFHVEISEKTKSEVLHDYESVGHHVFESKLLDGVQHPSPGYPSFKYLNVKELETDNKTIHKVRFQIFLTKIDQVCEETQPELLE